MYEFDPEVTVGVDVESVPGYPYHTTLADIFRHFQGRLDGKYLTTYYELRGEPSILRHGLIQDTYVNDDGDVEIKAFYMDEHSGSTKHVFSGAIDRFDDNEWATNDFWFDNTPQPGKNIGPSEDITAAGLLSYGIHDKPLIPLSE